jgi:FkbM family methyltransferase
MEPGRDRTGGLKATLRRVYRSIPAKQPVYELMRRMGTPPEKLHKHLLFNGVFEARGASRPFKMVNSSCELETALFWRGLETAWEPASMALWRRLCRDALVIMDVGANSGLYALVAKAENPTAEVHAFEPIDRMFEKLANNVRLNGFDIRCEKVALSNVDGVGVVYDPGGETLLSVTVNKDLNAPGVVSTKVEIPLARLDTYLARERTPRIDLMKIDVETHEYEVLQGFEQQLREQRPTMLIEIIRDEVGANVESLVRDLGYRYYNISEDPPGVRRMEHIATSDGYNYLLCSAPVARALGLD